MKPKDNPESKIPTTGTNTNKKRRSQIHGGGKNLDASFLKKNEFALIICGALLVTIIIFFFFFKSSSPEIEPVQKNISSFQNFDELENRIENLEQSIQVLKQSTQSSNPLTIDTMESFNPIKKRMTRLETQFSTQFDSIKKQMGKIENSISQFKGKLVASEGSKSSAKPIISVKKAMKKGKEPENFHTVQKGETLFGISQKYDTTVTDLQKLNKLSANTKIFPGDNIRIR